MTCPASTCLWFYSDCTKLPGFYGKRLFEDLCSAVCGLIFPVPAVHGRGAVRHIDQSSLDALSEPMTEPGRCAIHPYTLSLSQQGVWASFGHPNPQKISLSTLKDYVRNFLIIDFKHIMDFFTSI